MILASRTGVPVLVSKARRRIGLMAAKKSVARTTSIWLRLVAVP